MSARMDRAARETVVTGLIGWPVTHSVSPAMHHAAAAALGLPLTYAPFAVHPERLADALRALPALGIRGVNVTVPHKTAALRLMTELSAHAAAIGAVNTVVVDGDRLIGFNTDWSGFLADLDEKGVDIVGRRALVLGAGGAARAVVYALCQREAEVVVAARRPAQARRLAAELGLPGIQARDLAAIDALQPVALLVNTTPVGMAPHAEASPWPREAGWPGRPTVYDLIYNPTETALMRAARAAGLRAENGLGMLVQQGAQAFERWTGCAPPSDRMLQAAADALEQRA